MSLFLAALLLVALAGGTALAAAVWYLVRLTRQAPLPLATVHHDVAPQAQLHGGIAQVKKAVCRSCGASKLRAPRTAFLYCDYCGALVDWDFRISITTAGSAKPGPEYQRLQSQLWPLLQSALGRGDRDAYRETLTRLIDQHMSSCPAAYSPRLHDPAYRAAMLEFQVDCILETDFDPRTQELSARFQHAQRTLRPFPRPGLPAGIDAESARALCGAFLAHHDRFMQVAAPHIPKHPDGASFELISAIQKSIFAQTYLRNLDQPDQSWLIAELGLGGEYVPYREPPTSMRHCGGCGAEMPVVSGARRVVCEHCGASNDVARPELPCSGCGAPISIVLGRARLECPHCGVDLRVD